MAIAIILLDLSFERHEFRKPFMVLHISDSRVLSRQDRTLSLRYFFCFLVFSVSLISSSKLSKLFLSLARGSGEICGDADDADELADVGGDEGMVMI